MKDLIAALVIMLGAWTLIGLGVGIFLVVMTALGWAAAFGTLCGVTTAICAANLR